MPVSPHELSRIEVCSTKEDKLKAVFFDLGNDRGRTSPVMMRHTIIKMVAVCLAVVPAACDSPKDASKTNFTKGLNEHLGKECQMITVGLEQNLFPRTVEANGFSDLKQYDALVDAGLLTSKPDTVVTKDLYGNSRWSNPAKTYDLTAEGRKNFRSKKGYLVGFQDFVL